MLARTLMLSFTMFALAHAAPPRPQFKAAGAPAPSADAQASLAELNARASSQFRAAVRADGRIAGVAGGTLAVDGAGPETKARAFLAQHGALFGLDAAVELRLERRGSGDDRARFSLWTSGLAIAGARADVLFDRSGAVSGAAVFAPPSLRTIGAWLLTETGARVAGLAALGAERAARHKNAVLGPAAAEAQWRVAEGGLVPTWRIATAAVRSSDAEAWEVFVDGRDGSKVRILDRIERGTGFLPVEFDGSSITFQPFKTGTATGRVFKTQSAAIDGISSKKDLINFGIKGVPSAGVPKGFVMGARANVFDANGADPFSNALKFDFDPFDPFEADQFDVSNIYFQLESFFGHLTKNVSKNLASDFSIPVIVNVASTELNAFFAPDLFPNPVAPVTIGLLEFFDLSPFTADVADDVSRDAVACCHEYVHALMFYEALDFNDPLDFPSRAINEAVADFYASTFHGETVIGRYIAGELGLPEGFLRDLQDDDHFPQKTIAELYGMPPLPEEHGNSEIMGSALIDLREQLGDKAAEKLVFAGLPFMPRTCMEAGLDDGEVLADPVGATATFFSECAFGVLTAAKNGKELGAAIGAATGRGVFGDAASALTPIVGLESISKRTITYGSTVPISGRVQRFFFNAKQDRLLTIKLHRAPGSGLTFGIDIVASDATPNPVTVAQPGTFSADGDTFTQKNIVLNLPLTGDVETDSTFYSIEITVTGTGDYSLTLDA